VCGGAYISGDYKKTAFFKKENKQTTALLGVPVFALLYSETKQSGTDGMQNQDGMQVET
jgi:hypothetical protein